jgi:hypothetical protein
MDVGAYRGSKPPQCFLIRFGISGPGGSRNGYTQERRMLWERLGSTKTKNPAGTRRYGVFFYYADCLANYLLVPKRGLEPPHLAAHGPEPCASTNSATWANRYSEGCYFSERFDAVNGRVRNGSKGETKQRRGEAVAGRQSIVMFLDPVRARVSSSDLFTKFSIKNSASPVHSATIKPRDSDAA